MDGVVVLFFFVWKTFSLVSLRRSHIWVFYWLSDIVCMSILHPALHLFPGIPEGVKVLPRCWQQWCTVFGGKPVLRTKLHKGVYELQGCRVKVKMGFWQGREYGWYRWLEGGLVENLVLLDRFWYLNGHELIFEVSGCGDINLEKGSGWYVAWDMSGSVFWWGCRVQTGGWVNLSVGVAGMHLVTPPSLLLWFQMVNELTH